MKMLTNLFLFIVLAFSIHCMPSRVDSLTEQKVIIYTLPQYNTYITNVYCDELIKRDPKKIIVTDKKFSNKLLESVSSNCFVSKKEISNEIDTRIRFEYFENNQISKIICWSTTNIISVNDTVFICNDKFKDFLVDENLIIKISGF